MILGLILAAATNLKIKQEVLGRIVVYFPLIQHAPHRKRRLHQFFVAAGTMKGGIHFTEPLPSNDRRDTQTDTD
jgi:hypothetical protein